MSEPRWTNGPWIATGGETYGSGQWLIVPEAAAEDGAFALARVFVQNYHPDGLPALMQEAKANARLIAAAPELAGLAAHVAAMSDDAYLTGHPEWNAIAEEARALLARIEGEAK